jgi:hypothetical protein
MDLPLQLPSQPSKKAFWTVVSILSMMFSAVLLIFWFLFFEKPWLTYENIPFPPVTPVVQSGHIVPLEVERCNHSGKEQIYTITHSLQSLDNGKFIILPDTVVSMEPGCFKQLSLINRVPDEVPSGNYKVIGMAEIRGKLKNHYVSWQSTPFVVKGTVKQEGE